MDLTEAEDIKEVARIHRTIQRGLNAPDNRARHSECKVKWALGSISINKASGGDRIPVKLLQILEDDAVKALHSTCQQIWKTQQWSLDWKRSVFILIPKKVKAKEFSKYCTIALISSAS